MNLFQFCLMYLLAARSSKHSPHIHRKVSRQQELADRYRYQKRVFKTEFKMTGAL